MVVREEFEEALQRTQREIEDTVLLAIEAMIGVSISQHNPTYQKVEPCPRNNPFASTSTRTRHPRHSKNNPNSSS